ncbi:dioxygenase [Sulfuriferula plumbiphila]|uniref:Dioxygenase n=1 Tax=Sulfuriferula plumbiphila TaxID=171865 RepID=A0A512L9R9_9PROT|nr:class III extradiol ring-cleavage dioxygenase [Sulfuriferula plumbiphila]BBP03724.1 dioxygenase [Sulfuriferula plumbiphila]GEP31233.1 dioxygenase [Sulfuriferula plumbiphila]
MSARMPVVFVSHGAPDALLKAPDAVACWREIGQQAPEPAAILVVSAHWEARQPTASLSGAPQTMHDFAGFPEELYRMQYRAPGAPALAERAVSLLSAAGLAADLHPSRGLDHGAWAPLSAMYPQANVPVTQLSLARNTGAAAHVALGQALAPLREESVLIVASGAITHNFGWLDWHAEGDQAPLLQARMFTNWVAERLAAQDVSALLAYRSAPYGADAHPSEEHFLPLFVALGAARGDTPLRYRPHFAYGGLAMDAYVWRGVTQAS